MDILELDSYLEKSIPVKAVPKLSGIYFLLRDGEVVYIGQTRDVIQRINSHAYYRKFDSAKLFPIPFPWNQYEINKLEAALIGHYQTRQYGGKR